MWLLRGLKFTALGLRHNITNKEEELSVSFTKGYESSLRKYHSIMIRPVFAVSYLCTVLAAPMWHTVWDVYLGHWQ